MHINTKNMGTNSELKDIFLLSKASMQQARNGPYWKLELRDATRTFDAKIWSPLSQEFANLTPGMFVDVLGRLEPYRDQMQVIVNKMYILSDEQCANLNMADFMPSSPRPSSEMWDELCLICKQELKHKPWQKFVFSVLKNEDIKKEWLIAPAAKGVHHAYAGGLLEHTLGVVKLVMDMASHYAEIDRQVLLAGAIFHDLGKIWEFSGGLVNDYTTEGRLLGHIEIALERLQPFLQKSNLEAELAQHFKHIILSHHGTYEFGSPRLPQTAEAMLLHFADNIDAKMSQCRQIFSDIEFGAWSSYQPTLERYMYNAPQTPEQNKEKSSSATEAQCLSLLKV